MAERRRPDGYIQHPIRGSVAHRTQKQDAAGPRVRQESVCRACRDCGGLDFTLRERRVG